MCDTHLSKREPRVRFVLLIAAFLLCGAPVMAQSLCVEPTMPVPVDGAAATADQMRAAMAEARNFIAQSGLYQECLVREVEATKAQATSAGEPFEPMIEVSAHAKVDASRKAQEKVGVMANNAMASYKNAHPN
jgi:hypothetical protein